jgi:hypothetical protein
MSKYANDPRVVLHADGTATIPASPGYKHEGDWLVEHTPGGFVVRNDGGDQGYATDGGDRYNQRPKVFDTADEAVFHVIGDPE